jgi:hypothetical protein
MNSISCHSLFQFELTLFYRVFQEQELHERVGPVQPTGALQGAQGEGGDRER